MHLNKILLSLFLSAASTFAAIGQRFSHQTGLSLIGSWELPYKFTAVYPDRPAIEVETQRDYLWFVGANYHPSVRFMQWPRQQLSLSAGVPLSLSLFVGASSNQGASPNNYVLLSLPLQVAFNFGSGAVAGKGKIGGFIGAGAGLQMLHTRSFYYYDQPFRYRQINSYFSGGVRFVVLERVVELAFSRALPFEKRQRLAHVDATGTEEIWFPRSILRGTDVVSLSVFLGKKFKTELPTNN